MIKINIRKEVWNKLSSLTKYELIRKLETVDDGCLVIKFKTIEQVMAYLGY